MHGRVPLHHNRIPLTMTHHTDKTTLQNAKWKWLLSNHLTDHSNRFYSNRLVCLKLLVITDTDLNFLKRPHHYGTELNMDTVTGVRNHIKTQRQVGAWRSAGVIIIMRLLARRRSLCPTHYYVNVKRKGKDGVFCKPLSDSDKDGN